MRRKLLAIIPLIALLTAVTACDQHSTPTSSPLTIRGTDGVSYDFNVEIADEPAELEHGLMDRDSMKPDHGMLFIFPAEEMVSFWMKNTHIFLDMIFIGNDGTILHIHHKARPLDETQISSKMPIRAVLEINGGMAKQLGLKNGDKVTPILW